MPDPVVTTSERLWSEEVGLANANEVPKPVPVYEWSNGKTHADGSGPYANNPEPEAP